MVVIVSILLTSALWLIGLTILTALWVTVYFYTNIRFDYSSWPRFGTLFLYGVLFNIEFYLFGAESTPLHLISVVMIQTLVACSLITTISWLITIRYVKPLLIKPLQNNK
jgi:hypothetical protein